MTYLFLTTDGTLEGTALPVHNPFPFVLEPGPLDRDYIIVPAGWDSWEKLARST